MKSKYLGKTINGWKVTDVTPTTGNHSIFTLKRKSGFVIKAMTVRDNELTKMSQGKTIENELSGKTHQVGKNIRIPQNTVRSRFSLFNLFRSI